IPEIAELLSDAVCRTLLSYYRCAFRLQAVQVWRNHHVPQIDNDRDDVFSNTFHNDGTPATGVHLLVLLNDGVTRETGAFRFHDRAASERIMRSLGYFHRGLMTEGMKAALLDPRSLQYFEGNTGDALLCNTQHCLHAASVPRAGAFRDMLQ